MVHLALAEASLEGTSKLYELVNYMSPISIELILLPQLTPTASWDISYGFLTTEGEGKYQALFISVLIVLLHPIQKWP